MTTDLMIEPVVEAPCKEHNDEEPITRFVYPMPLSIDNLKEVWERSKEHTTLFSQEVRADFNKFISLFVKEGRNGIEATGLFWVVDDFVGVFYMTEIMDHDALVHYSFFDGRFKGRAELARRMLKFAFEKFNFVRLTAVVPVYAPPALTFARLVGFSEEGRKRKAILYKDSWHDLILFGVLREEVLNGG